MTSLHAVPRRLSTTLVGVLLASSGLVVGAGTASAAPTDPDLAGTVTNAAGAPVAGIEVTAFPVAGTGAASPVGYETAVTGADGRYTFVGLDPESLTTASKPVATRFKLQFVDGNAGTYAGSVAAYRTLGFETRYLGHTLSSRNSPDVVVPAGGLASAPTERLVQYGGIQVTLLDPSGQPISDYGYVRLFNSDDDIASTLGTTDDDPGSYPLPAVAPKDGVVTFKNLTGGDTYRAFGNGQTINPVTGAVTFYLPKFGTDAFTLATATPIPVVAGQYTQATIRLSNGLPNVTAPQIVGNASYGSTLTALPGTWAKRAGTEYTYQWLRSSTPVAAGPSYVVTAADKKAQLRVVVTAYNNDFVGTAASLPTAKVGEQSAVKARKVAGGLVSVAVRAASRTVRKKIGDARGKVMLVTAAGVKASRQVKLRDGAATLKPNGRADGPLTVVYLGGGRLGPDTATVKGGKGGTGSKKGGKKKKG